MVQLRAAARCSRVMDHVYYCDADSTYLREVVRMILECPHCHRRVMPLKSGECPACHENTADKSGADESVTLLSVTETTKFPNNCCTCYEATSNFIKVQHSGRMAGVSGPKKESLSGGDVLAIRMFGLLGALACAIRVGGSGGGSGRSTLRLRVPQCKRCVANGQITPASADLEHYRLSLLVDRRFADEVKRMN